MSPSILAPIAKINLTLTEVKLLRVAVVFWLGMNQETSPRAEVTAARHLSRRLDAVVLELTGKPSHLTWRCDGLDARTLQVIRYALPTLSGTLDLLEKFL